MIKDDDEALVESCRKGDRAAFEVLVRRYQHTVYNAAYRVLGSVDDANDITQVVFVKVLERLDEYDPNWKFFSWIYRIAINESINVQRRRVRDRPIDEAADFTGPDGADPEWQLQNGQRATRVQKALMSMKADDRVVLTLRHFSECSYQEMARILDLEEKTVKSRLFEARQRLSTLLKDAAPELI